MKNSLLTLILTWLALSLASLSSHAQLVADGATNTLSNVTSSISGDVIVGTNGSFTLLILSDNSLLTNSVNGFIGRNATAKSNEVQLVSATARWRMGANLFVGSNGSSSRLVVSNGALLENNNGNLGFLTASTNNSALVTGPGSLWTNRGSFSISGGFLSTSRSNRLVVSDSAALVSGGSAFVGGFRNQVLITGAGSRWANQSDFNLGGTDNQVELSDGGGLVSSNAIIGDLFSSNTNTFLLTGSGTAWTNGGNLTMGFSSAVGVLTVSNGATLVVGGRAFLGANSGANFNRVSITDPGTLWTIGSDLSVGGGSSGNVLVISNGGFVVSSNALLGAILGASFNSALVTGAGSVWSNRNDFVVGNSDRNNQLVVSSGGAVFTATNGFIGANANGNNAIVTDAGSSWLLGQSLFVGSNAAFNTLVVSNGGQVMNSIGEVGFSTGSGSNNLAVVTGPGSVWSNSVQLVVGRFGPGNQLQVSNGGRVESNLGILGANASSSNITALVSGPGSVLNIGSSLTVGSASIGNRLVISNGGAVRANNSTVGFGGTSSNNEAVVTSPASIWSNAVSLSVGGAGRASRLVVTNGGTVIAGDRVSIGEFNASSNNRVVVHGGTLRVTNASVTGALDVRRGTNVFNTGLIEVDVLRMTNTLSKFEFNGGTLITRGAFIRNGENFVVGAAGTNRAIWNVRAGVSHTFLDETIIVGGNASFNQLILTNGNLLTNSGFADLGQNFGANSNSAVVAGAGSQWFLGDGLVVGRFGSGNRLLVSDGGGVAGSQGIIGQGPGSTNNLAVVADPGSTWSNATELRVGNSGPRNQLVVSNGGTAFAGSAVYVGFASTSTNNRITVNSGTLRVTNVSATGTLDVRRGTTTVTAGLVEVDRLFVTNALGQFLLNGGTLSTKSTTVGSGTFFHVGNNIGPATMFLAGNGTHVFGLSLSIDDNSTLTGNGTIGGVVLALNSGTISPGASIGKMIFTNSPFLLGRVFMEISKNGAVLTNDQIQVTAPLTYGGSLIVSNLVPTALAAGDRFRLFSATSYAGSFSFLTLPALPAPLFWKNNLLVNGSLEVAAPPAIPLSAGPHTQNFDTLATNGSANLWRDNSTLPGWYAAKSVAPTNITTYRASDGSDNAGALYSFGTTGSGERALGSIGSGSVDTISYGLGFTNDTGASVSNFVLSYTGEQWRDSSSFNTNALTFWYRVSAIALTNPEPGTVTGWTAQTSLHFASPTVTGAGVGINGNTTTNRQLFASVPVSGLTVPPGHCVFFRWQDPDDPGTDEGIAVDDLTVTFGVTLPQLTSVSLTTNGFLQFTGQNEANAPFGIETATNLTPPIFWQLIFTNTADANGLFQFSDTNAPAFPMRFYRALFP